MTLEELEEKQIEADYVRSLKVGIIQEAIVKAFPDGL